MAHAGPSMQDKSNSAMCGEHPRRLRPAKDAGGGAAEESAKEPRGPSQNASAYVRMDTRQSAKRCATKRQGTTQRQNTRKTPQAAASRPAGL